MDGRRVRGLRSRVEILDTASRLMSQHGYDRTSIALISQESGLPTGSIYHHFASKSAILAAVMERGAQRFFEAAEYKPSTSNDPYDRLAHALDAARQSLAENEEFLRLLFLLLLSNDNDDAADVVRRVRTEGRERLRLVIHDAFVPQGERVAKNVADQLVDFALATFDGIFIAAQFDPALVYRNGFDTMALSISDLGRRILDTAQRPATRTS
jgi:AcrR family transcriptional regulator